MMGTFPEVLNFNRLSFPSISWGLVQNPMEFGALNDFENFHKAEV